MRIWVDGDACPTEIKDLLYRTAIRRTIPLTLVANTAVHVPRSEWIDSVVVSEGPDVADHHIATSVGDGDLVITADIPLAARVVEANATALNPRGQLYTAETIGSRLAARNLMDELRSAGHVTSGPKPLSGNDKQAFANQLDRWITARLRRRPRNSE